MQKLVFNLPQRFRLESLSGFKRVPVEFADRHEIRLTVMIEVVGKLFQSKSARPDARRKKDERQQRENYSKGSSHLKIPDANNLHTGKPPHTTCQAFNFFEATSGIVTHHRFDRRMRSALSSVLQGYIHARLLKTDHTNHISGMSMILLQLHPVLGLG